MMGDAPIPVSVTPSNPTLAEPKWVTAKALSETAEVEIPWFWEGYLAPGLITLFSARPKTGKTTLLFHFLRAWFKGLPFLGGGVHATGKVLLLTEEGKHLLRPRLLQFGVAQEEDLWIVRRPTISDWRETADVIEQAASQGVRLAVVDTLAVFWGVHDENDASGVTRAMSVVQRLAQERNIAFWLDHHLRKVEGDDGTAHRGSGALVAAVDIAVEMLRVPNQEHCRKLRALSRSDTTPGELIVKLDGGEYVSLGIPGDVSREEVHRQVLARLPRNETEAIERDQLREHMDPKSSSTLLKEILADLVTQGAARRVGDGHKGSPYRYWRPNSDSATPTI